jgi:tetratricopeptide (TPR) repeat protein
VLAGRGEFILDELRKLEAELEPPIDGLIHVGYLIYHLAEGNLEESEFHAGRVVRLIEQFDRKDLEYRNDFAQAGIHEMKGDLAGAVHAMESALAKYSVSVQSIETSEDLVRICNDLGRYRREAGDLDGAEAALQQALDVYPAHPITNLEMSRIAQQRGDVTAARERLSHSLTAWSQADPDYSYAREARALEAELAVATGSAARAVPARAAGANR